MCHPPSENKSMRIASLRHSSLKLCKKTRRVCSVPALSLLVDVFSLVNSIFLLTLHLSMCAHCALKGGAVLDYIDERKQNQGKIKSRD